MKDEGKLSTDIISNLDQFDAMMTNFAPIVGSYYGALLASGVPDTLACQLTIEWHNIFWSTQYSNAKGKK